MEMTMETLEDVTKAVEEARKESLAVIYKLCRAAELKDEGSGAHIERVSLYSAAIARAFGLNDHAVREILFAAPMHDVGKIVVPDHILMKPEGLTADEWEVMKGHTIMGAGILEGTNIELLEVARAIALTHHEKWDGSGYPRELAGVEIPIAGRIAGLADVFDALTSKRPYREPFPLDKAFDIVKEAREVYFDPDLVDAFFGIEDEIVSIRQRYDDR